MNLAIDNVPVSVDEWHRLAFRLELLQGVREHIDAQGYSSPISKRRYQRMLLRKIAIGIDGENRFPCYAKDLSRAGVGFYSTIRLDRGKTISLWLPSGQTVCLRVVRSRELAQYCHEIGTVFQASEVES
jgi:hypothetical protein